MSILEKISQSVQSIWDGVVRLFSSSDDDYPQSGTQPFEGDPYDEKKHSHDF